MSEQTEHEQAVAEYVKAAAPIVEAYLWEHRQKWHQTRPRVGCPSCLFSGRVGE